MSIYHLRFKFSLIRYLLISSLVIIAINSCRKFDAQTVKYNQDLTEIDAFFKIPEGADPLLVRVIAELRKRNATHPFIKRLIEQAGIPQWTYSEIKLPNDYEIANVKVNSSAYSINSNNSQLQKDSTLLVPFVYKNAKRVNSFLSIRISDSMPIGLYMAKDYARYGYEKKDERPTAKDIAMRCMLFDQKIFKSHIFKIRDKNLAMSFSNGRDNSGLLILNNNESQKKPAKYKDNLVIAVTTCEGGQWMVDPNGHFEGYNWSQQPLIYVGGDCSTQYFNFADPVYQEPDFGSAGLMTSGGSGGVSSMSDYQYGEGDRQPEAWEETDINGYYQFRMDALNALLEEEAFHIIPCAELKIMPLDDNNGGYGLMFKRVAQKEVSSIIKTRLDSIANVAPSSILSTFKVQNINNAFGPVVNCDYFAVHISALPPNITPDGLLEFFRKYTNTYFIDPSIGVTFSPYTDGSFTDATKFYSDFEQSLGSILHLNLLNDGTVVESEYYRSTSPYKSRFTYSTISSPLDASHPVSGNREFGLFANPNNNGYTFYTMGVDRTTDWLFALGNSASWGFNAADRLWSNVQLKMAAYINNNGGQAYVQMPVIARPKWNHVDRYLRGEISFTLLKKLLGCQ